VRRDVSALSTMPRKTLILVVILVAVAVFGTIGLRSWAKANPYSAHYRHTVQTQLTLRLLTTALGAYRAQYSSVSQADNVAILRQLLGDNPDKTVFIEAPRVYDPSSWPPAFATDPHGRVVDGWNTPLRFRFGDQIRVESAGEDRQFDTPDDLVETIPGR
jgi:hypothetical protein